MKSKAWLIAPFHDVERIHARTLPPVATVQAEPRCSTGNGQDPPGARISSTSERRLIGS